jgi:hypothetical protein
MYTSERKGSASLENDTESSEDSEIVEAMPIQQQRQRQQPPSLQLFVVNIALGLTVISWFILTITSILTASNVMTEYSIKIILLIIEILIGIQLVSEGFIGFIVKETPFFIFLVMFTGGLIISTTSVFLHSSINYQSYSSFIFFGYSILLRALEIILTLRIFSDENKNLGFIRMTTNWLLFYPSRRNEMNDTMMITTNLPTHYEFPHNHSSSAGIYEQDRIQGLHSTSSISSITSPSEHQIIEDTPINPMVNNIVMGPTHYLNFQIPTVNSTTSSLSFPTASSTTITQRQARFRQFLMMPDCISSAENSGEVISSLFPANQTQLVVDPLREDPSQDNLTTNDDEERNIEEYLEFEKTTTISVSTVDHSPKETATSFKMLLNGFFTIQSISEAMLTSASTKVDRQVQSQRYPYIQEIYEPESDLYGQENEADDERSFEITTRSSLRI